MEKFISNVSENDSPRHQRISKRQKKRRNSNLRTKERKGSSASLDQTAADDVTSDEDYKDFMNLIYQEKYTKIREKLEEKRSLVHSHNNENRMTALHVAAKQGNLKMMRLLIDYGANVRATTLPFRQNVLHILAMQKGDRREYLDCMRCVIQAPCKKRININAQDYSGNTALHWASFSGNISMVEFLLNCGVDRRIRNFNKKYNTAFWSAKKGKHAAIVVLLGLSETNRQEVSHHRINLTK